MTSNLNPTNLWSLNVVIMTCVRDFNGFCGFFLLCLILCGKPLYPLEKKLYCVSTVAISLCCEHQSIPFSWCAPACVHVLAESTDVGTLYHPSQASPDHSAQCSPLYGIHLNTQDTRVCEVMSRQSSGLGTEGYSHMLSCRTKLAILLCLKYFGRTSLAKRPWSNTWKLVPDWKRWVSLSVSFIS